MKSSEEVLWTVPGQNDLNYYLIEFNISYFAIISDFDIRNSELIIVNCGKSTRLIIVNDEIIL